MASPAGKSRRITRGEARSLAGRLHALDNKRYSAKVIYEFFTPEDLAVFESFLALVNEVSTQNGKRL